MDLTVQEVLSIAQEACLAGAPILLQYLGRLDPSKIVTKSDSSDLVTEADKAAEVAILEVIRRRSPSTAILAEESGWNHQQESFWAVDPLDGTTNYSHAYPCFCISVGFCKNRKPFGGAIYNPLTKEMYVGGQGHPATLNGKPIHVSRVEELSKSLLITGFPYVKSDPTIQNYTEFAALTDITHGVRRDGSAALDCAYIAAGRGDGFWEAGLQVWDLAAGVAIIEAAGGKVTAQDLGPFDIFSGRMLASNGTALHGEVARVLAEVRDGKERKLQHHPFNI